MNRMSAFGSRSLLTARTIFNYQSIKPLVPGSKMAVSGPLEISRGKRTHGKDNALSAGAARIVTMLSVLSARKKQPRRLKLCLEDLIRHNTVQKAWAIQQRNARQKREAQLKSQYEKIQEACTELESIDPYLFYQATKREKGKRFSIEMRIPTESPPHVIWELDWKPPK